jgi:excisionase family DNA binding protein
MTFLSVRAAAQLTGKSRSTILRAIQSGRLPATKTGKGAYALDPADLCRVFPVSVAPVAAEPPIEVRGESERPEPQPSVVASEPATKIPTVDARIRQAQDRCQARVDLAMAAQGESARFTLAGAFSNIFALAARAIAARILTWRARLMARRPTHFGRI